MTHLFRGKVKYPEGAKKMTLESKIFRVIFLIEKHRKNLIAMRFMDTIKFPFYVVLRNFKKYGKLPFGDTRVCPSTTRNPESLYLQGFSGLFIF